MKYPKTIFSRFASKTSHLTGHPLTFFLAVLVIIFWAVTGPIFHYSDTWQLVINTSTTIITFLMVFLVQNTQNRDNYALQVKVDELIRAVEGAHNALLDIEELTEEDLLLMKMRYSNLARKAREEMRTGKLDTGRPELD